VEGVMVEPTMEFAQLQLGFVDQTQERKGYVHVEQSDLIVPGR
jgi:hypothetical protein